MTDETTPDSLWTPHSVAETQKIYRDWAGSYDSDVGAMGYATPARIAMALRQAGANPSKPVLDYGCGTGLSGMALKAVGFDIVDGTDISPEMLDGAQAKGVYRQVWLGQPGTLGHIGRGDYPIIAACGVISIGAAPAQTLDLLIDALGPAGLLAFSYNDATLKGPDYTGLLEAVIREGKVEKLHQEHGPHLPAKNMSSTVYVLQKP